MAELDTKPRSLVVHGRLPVPHARELAKVLDSDKRFEIALRAAADPRGSTRRGREYAWPIADLRREVAKVYCSLGQVPWKLDAPFAGKPACSDCPENSANKPGLFEGAAPVHGWSAFKEPAAGICLSRACFGAKSAAVTRAAGTAARLTISAAKPAKGKPAAPVPPAPTFVQPAKFKTAVAEKVDAAKTARKDGAGKSSVPKSVDAARAAEIAADQKYRADRRDWLDESIKRIRGVQVMKSRRFLELYLEVFSREIQCGKRDRRADAILLTEIMEIGLRTEVATPELQVLERCLRHADIEVEWWTLGVEGYLQPIATALGINIPTEPTPPAAPKRKGKKK